MRVIDHEEGWWFLLEEDSAVFLHAICAHGAISIDFMLQLNKEELEAYAHEGRAYISRLAIDIEYSAPASKLSTSLFKKRRLSQIYSEKVNEAIDNWWAKKRSIEGCKSVAPIVGNAPARSAKKKPWYKLW